MQYTEQQIAEFKAEFARRRKRQLLATLPIFVLILLMVILRTNPDASLFGISIESLGKPAFFIALGLLAFSLWNWRCPACNRYMGKGVSPSFCAKCGTPLQ